jgi:AraC-like DNA-binding protein
MTGGAWLEAGLALEWDMRSPSALRRAAAPAWTEQALFLQALPNFFHSFVNLSLSLVMPPEEPHEWLSLVHAQSGVNLVHFEGSVDRLADRQRYHGPILKRVRRSGRAVIGSFAGAHDAFVPVLRKGKVEAVLVSGPFFTAQPTAAQLAANYAQLLGRQRAQRSARLEEYARIAAETPVLDPPVLKGYIKALQACAEYLGGGIGGGEAAAELKRLQLSVFAPRFPWRSWNFVAGRRDRRFYEFHVQPKLMPWDRVELGLDRYPTVAFAVALAQERGRTLDEVEEIAANAALQRRVFHLARAQPGCIAGRMDSTGAFVLGAPPEGAGIVRIRHWVRDCAERISQPLRREFGRSVVVGVGALEGGPERLPEAMHEAAVALHLGTRLGQALTFFDQQPLDPDARGPQRLFSRLEALRDAYSRALYEESALVADQYVAEVLMLSQQGVEAMRLHFLHAFNALDGTLRKRALLPSHRHEQFVQLWLERLEDQTSQRGLISAFREMLGAFLSLLTAPAESDRLLRLEQAKRYLDQHYVDVGSIREVAKVGGFSPSRFSRLFRQAQGMGFAEYLLKRRVEHACHLLLHSRLPIQQVAVESGFSSLSYFSQAFRKALKTTPKQFRLDGSAQGN